MIDAVILAGLGLLLLAVVLAVRLAGHACRAWSDDEYAAWREREDEYALIAMIIALDDE